MGIEAVRGALLRVPPGPARGALVPAIYAALARGELTNAEAGELDALARSRERPGAGPSVNVSRRVRREGASARCAPDGPAPRLSLRRALDLEPRRRWAASGWLPPQLAQRFTPGELAVLSVVASYVHGHGTFAWGHARLARVAGVSETLARNALRHARRLGLISAEERRATAYRHRPNLVRIVSREWSAWLRGRTPRQGVKNRTPDSTVKEKQGFSGERMAPAGAAGLDSRSARGPGTWRNPSGPGQTPSG